MKRSCQENRQKVVECVLCSERHSPADAISGKFWVETLVCSQCYAKMQAAPRRESCFGKQTVTLPSGEKLLGFDPSSKACSKLCPDRRVCAVIFSESPRKNS